MPELFARAELAVMQALETGREAGLITKIPHLAGQRLAALQTLIDKLELTEKQGVGLEKAVSRWKQLEERRLFLAHGIARMAYETSGGWILLLDVRVYRAQKASDNRWTLTRAEADAFQNDLKTGFETLTQRLGGVRKQLGSSVTA